MYIKAMCNGEILLIGIKWQKIHSELGKKNILKKSDTLISNMSNINFKYVHLFQM